MLRKGKSMLRIEEMLWGGSVLQQLAQDFANLKLDLGERNAFSLEFSSIEYHDEWMIRVELKRTVWKAGTGSYPVIGSQGVQANYIWHIEEGMEGSTLHIWDQGHNQTQVHHLVEIVAILFKEITEVIERSRKK
jgi:hypothetical protein